MYVGYLAFSKKSIKTTQFKSYLNVKEYKKYDCKYLLFFASYIPKNLDPQNLIMILKK